MVSGNVIKSELIGHKWANSNKHTSNHLPYTYPTHACSIASYDKPASSKAFVPLKYKCEYTKAT